MMQRCFSSTFFVFIFACLLLFSCSSIPEPVEEPAMESEPVEEVRAEETVAQEEPEPVVEVAADNEEIESAEESEVAEETFAVSEEVYAETFEDIRQLIDDLNAIVREENYGKWLTYLTDDYITHFSSAEVLADNSNQPVLKKYKVTLSSLQDYFKWVVAPSRQNAKLDDLVFIDNEHVKAIMINKGQRTILYLLEKDGEGWKIGR